MITESLFFYLVVITLLMVLLNALATWSHRHAEYFLSNDDARARSCRARDARQRGGLLFTPYWCAGLALLAAIPFITRFSAKSTGSSPN